MKRVLSALVLYVTVTMANPVIYAGLGDVIYDAMPKMAQLANVGAMAHHRENILQYLKKCEAARERGYALDKEGDDASRKAYIETLRALNGQHEFFIRTAHAALNQTIIDNDYQGFSALIKTGAIEIDRDPDQIVGFYELKRGESRLAEIEDYLNYRAALVAHEKEEKAKRQEIYDGYKQRRIDQVRARQEAKKKAQVRAINEETEQRKEALHRQQAEALEETRRFD